MLTEKVLLERLNLDVYGLERARERYGSGDEAGAVDAVVEYFRTRNAPAYLFGEEDIDRKPSAPVLAEADAVCGHAILGLRLGPKIDWRKNESEATTKDPEWMWALARNLFWVPLARAYAMTGDEKYAKEFADQLKGFIKGWPVEEFLGKIGPHGEDMDMVYPANAWRTIEAAVRLYCVWLPLLVFFRASPSVDRETWVLWLNSFCEHGEFLHTHYSAHHKCSNWDTMESSALFQLGLVLPEFKAAAQWAKAGYRRAMNDVRYQFDHEGIHIERTPIYHLTAAGAFVQVWRMAQLHHLPVPPYMPVILERAAAFLMRLTKPDFSTPMTGDADRNSFLDRKSDTAVYEGMNNTTFPADENELRAFFRLMAKLCRRSDFLYLASGGSEGAPPEELCCALPEAGYYVCRSGWGKKDSWFMLCGSNLERGENSVHSHYDAGHLELQVEGVDVLVDGGRYIYNSVSQFAWRIYFSSTRAHNTLLVDEHTMGEHPDVISSARGVRLFCQRFAPGKEQDILEVSHNGYAFMEDPVFHTRRVVWLKPDVWVVEDELTGLGRHKLRLFFNFAPGVLAAKTPDGHSYTYEREGLQMEISALAKNGLESQTLHGSEAPIGGWVSYGYATKQPAPQLIYEKNSSMPARFVTVFAKKGVVRDATLCEGEMPLLRLDTKHGGFTVCLGTGGGQAEKK